MAPPNGTTEITQRLHAALTALDPDLAPPLPDNPTTKDTALLLGLLLAHGDNLLDSQPDEDVAVAVASYNQILGNSPDVDTERTRTYQRFAKRIRFTGATLIPVSGRGPGIMMSGCLAAAYEGAHLGMFTAQLANADPDQVIDPDTTQRMNQHLVTAQEHLASAYKGIGLLAGYPDGQPTGETLHSDDPRITKITDFGGTLGIEYSFDTPDGPITKHASANLSDVTELVGLDADERRAMLIDIVESSVDDTQAQFMQAPPTTEDDT